MSLALALLGYGYLCFDGYAVMCRVQEFGHWTRVTWQTRHEAPAWLMRATGRDLLVDAVLMGGAFYLALTHTLR